MLQKFTERKNLLTAAILLCFCAFTNKAMGQTWNIGNPGYNSNVTATLSGNTLTINGNGDMVDFWSSSAGEAPWYSVYRNNITTVVFGSGSNVTNIGNRAFDKSTETYTFIPTSGIRYYVYIAYYSTSGTSTQTGTFTISRTGPCSNGINDVISSQLSIFPNPAKDEIFIKSELPINKVEICSLTGSVLLSENNFNEKVSISALPQGIYLLKAYTDKGLIISKIVKE